MTNQQMITLILSILIPMFCGFGFIIMWLRSIDAKINNVTKRLTIIETIFMMMGYPIKSNGTDSDD